MVATRMWRIAGALVLGALSAAASARDDDFVWMWIKGNSEEGGLKQLENSIGDIDALDLRNIRLEDLLPYNLAKRAPHIAWVGIGSLLAPSGKKVEGVTPCTSVHALEMDSSFGSLGNLEWINALFPNVNKVFVTARGFPLQSQKHAERRRKEGLEMKHVTEVEITSQKHDLNFFNEMTTRPPMFENLALFPNATSFAFRDITTPKCLENFQDTDVILRVVREIEIDELPANQVLLKQLAAVFPSLISMSINADMLYKLTNGGLTGASYLPFANLTKLTVKCRGEDLRLHFGAKIAGVFPSLREIKLLGPGRINVPSWCWDTDAKLPRKVESVTIYDGKEAYESDYFEDLFPGLGEQGLKLIRCGQKP